MEVYIITPFPDSIKTLIDNNIANQGLKKGHLSIEIVNLRDFTTDNYKKIDDEPYGGGSGMVMMCEPLFGAIEYCISKSEKKPKIIFPSPKGKVLNHSLSSNLSTESSLIFICGHYKGVDERVIEKYVDFEISIGDFIISNGELSTMIIFDSIVRLVPGVLNDINSALTDSFVDDLLDAPYFTRPSEIDGLKVPDVLLSGDHKAIEKWRNDKKLELTKDRRPDLLEKD
jgi:tRNA (guanine37-N1)-methyltransferase|tara:strand:- start:278 stop:961 length:684 start_codon:yes stop_codon:yes gene_type:complete